MHLIEWSGRLSVGIPRMDQDHRRMFELLERLADNLTSAAPPERLAAILGDLIVDTEAHFQREETLLDLHNYPDLPAHRAEHGRLLVQIRHCRDRLAGEAPCLPTLATADFLRAWLLDHIRTQDVRYRPFVMQLY